MQQLPTMQLNKYTTLDTNSSPLSLSVHGPVPVSSIAGLAETN
jgi:hypothetical protein